MPSATLETVRLILRPLTPEDAEAAFVWCSDERVNKYMSYPLYTSVEEVRAWISGLADSPGYVFGIVLKENGALIGSCGIFHNTDENAWTFGCNLRVEYWNKGYATEATKRMIAFVHDELGGHDFFSQHAIDNPASGRVMEKCGLKFDRYSECSKLDNSETFKSRLYKMHFD